MKIVLMRGLPGSGKSTWVKNLTQAGTLSFLICSADDYHLIDGRYCYDPKNAGKAHGACLRRYANTITSPVHPDLLIVDNTNTTLMELAPYVRLAEAYEVPYEIVYLACPLETAIRHNTHQVPLNTLLKMQANLLTEIVPAHWNQQVVFHHDKQGGEEQ